MQVITRSEARNLDLTHYYTGKVCKRGHLSKRRVSTKTCCQCSNEDQIVRRSNPETMKKERDQARTRWKKSPKIREKKKIADKARRSTESHKEAQRKKDREKYDLDPVYRQRKINSACQYFQDNKEKVAERKKKWFKKKYRTDDNFKTKHLLRSMVARVIKGAKTEKSSSTFDCLGYSASDFRSHIEKQFTRGMSWDNHGDWHIDHVIPVSFFIKSGEVDPAVVNALHNLKPLWAEDNHKKSDRVDFLL